MSTGNPITQSNTERAACTGHPNPDQAADTGLADAMDLITDIRDIDPRQVWGRLETWAANDPKRLVAVAIVLAAWCDPTVSARSALAWTDSLVSWRGVA